jgi:hypothetical protein
MRGCRGVALALLGLAPLLARAELESPPPGLDALLLMRGADALLQSDGTYIEAEMTVEKPDANKRRALRLHVWTDRTGDRSFIRILAPARHAGTGFLEVRPNIWKYVPRLERTRRIPASAMGEDWMGSDWAIRDLFSDPKRLEHYEHRLQGIDPAPPGHRGLRAYRIESVALEATPAPWARIVSWVEVEHGTPLWRHFYDAKGEHRRTLKLGAIRAVQGRQVPHAWVMVPVGKKGEKKGRSTTIALDEIRFDQVFSEEIFTTRQLRTWP